MHADIAKRFADEWVEAWNSHDLDRIVSHFTDDVVFMSPYMVELLGKPSGQAEGIDELRSYWRMGLDAQPDLHFTLQDVRASVDTVVINYRNQRGGAVTEVLRLRDGRAHWGCAAYES